MPLTVGRLTGIGPNGFAYHNKMYFSTPNNDNDESGSNCADNRKSAWWYKSCDHVDINKQPPSTYSDTLFSEMKIRPKDCITQ